MKNNSIFVHRINLKDGAFEIESTIETNGEGVVLSGKKLQSMQIG